jgi:hypothetical protein
MDLGAECLELVCILCRAGEAENLVTVGEELPDDGSSDKASGASDEDEHPVCFLWAGRGVWSRVFWLCVRARVSERREGRGVLSERQRTRKVEADRRSASSCTCKS